MKSVMLKAPETVRLTDTGRNRLLMRRSKLESERSAAAAEVFRLLEERVSVNRGGKFTGPANQPLTASDHDVLRDARQRLAVLSDAIDVIDHTLALSVRITDPDDEHRLADGQFHTAAAIEQAAVEMRAAGKSEEEVANFIRNMLARRAAKKAHAAAVRIAELKMAKTFLTEIAKQVAQHPKAKRNIAGFIPRVKLKINVLGKTYRVSATDTEYWNENYRGKVETGVGVSVGIFYIVALYQEDEEDGAEATWSDLTRMAKKSGVLDGASTLEVAEADDDAENDDSDDREGEDKQKKFDSPLAQAAVNIAKGAQRMKYGDKLFRQCRWSMSRRGIYKLMAPKFMPKKKSA